MITIERTVEIPASRRLVIDVPHEVPVGPAILAFMPATVEAAPRRRLSPREAVEKARGIARGVLSSDELLEMRREDKELDNAQYRRAFPAAQGSE